MRNVSALDEAFYHYAKGLAERRLANSSNELLRLEQYHEHLYGKKTPSHAALDSFRSKIYRRHDGGAERNVSGSVSVRHVAPPSNDLRRPPSTRRYLQVVGAPTETLKRPFCTAFV